MKINIIRLTLCVIFIIILAGCSGEAKQTVEVTRLVPQTIEVTREVIQTVKVIQTRVPVTPTQTTPISPDLQIDIDPGYFDGLIVLTQYYTLLGHGFYEEAFNLLSTNSRSYSSAKDNFLSLAKISFRKVEIVSIVPYYLDIRAGGVPKNPDPIDKKRYTVKIKAWGVGDMSGSVPSGVLQTLYVGLIQTDGVWKIDTFATAPLP